MDTLIIKDTLLKGLSVEEENSYKKLEEARKNFEKDAKIDFSICITDEKMEDIEKFSLVYILNSDPSVEETNSIRRIDCINAKQMVFELAAQDFNNRKKTVLLYLGKFPGYGFDIDGGSILARQLINLLKVRCNLTVCFIRKNLETFQDPEVCDVRYVEYIDPWNNKFVRRMENLDTNYQAMKDFENFDIVIAGHISKFFGMDKCGEDFWKRAIIFPMFCTSSYIRAGENVPEEYTMQEKIVVSNVAKIITPSFDEKRDLITDYNCDENKIDVVYRGITPLIHYEKREKIHSILNIVCIGTIKKQKNTKETIHLMKILNQNDVPFKLHLVATIQDKEYYEEFCELVKTDKLCDYVKYHISIPQSELAELLKEMDINVSMSSWETFGRGIFEGASAGLPTFAFDMLETVKELSECNGGFYFASSVQDMAKRIIEVTSNHELYSYMSEQLGTIIPKFSYKNEQNLLRESIFGGG